jgi:hypothetical protein
VAFSLISHRTMEWNGIREGWLPLEHRSDQVVLGTENDLTSIRRAIRRCSPRRSRLEPPTEHRTTDEAEYECKFHSTFTTYMIKIVTLGSHRRTV